MLKVRTSAALLAALAAAMSAAAFPLEVTICNDGYAPLVESETSTFVDAYGRATVMFSDADRLIRAVGNIEQINALMGAHPEAGLSVELPFGDDVAAKFNAATGATVATAAADDAAAAAELARQEADAAAARAAEAVAAAEREAAEKADAEQRAAEAAAAAEKAAADKAAADAAAAAAATQPAGKAKK